MKRFSTYFSIVCLTLTCLFNVANAQVANEPVEEVPVEEVPVEELPEEGIQEPEVYFPSAGPKIVGPWLWMIVPTGKYAGKEAAASGRDYLARASGGTVKQGQIAKEGATGGTLLGDKVWTWGKLAPFDGNNINWMVNDIGLGDGDIDDHVAYGSISLESPRRQETTMYAGSDDALKVWLNGKLVHNNLLTELLRATKILSLSPSNRVKTFC